MSVNVSQVAKNSAALYFRMLFTLALGLYTGRLVIDKLGIVDYGIYAVVGGVMGSMFFVVSSLRSTTQRFIIYGLGEHDTQKLKKTFGNIMTVHLALAAIMVLLGETIGLWWVCNKLVVPEGRLTATIWAYQFSIASVVFEIISAPYNMVIVAHERMNVYAYLSILDALLKLGIVFLITYAPFDRLVFYAFLLMLVGLFDRVIYGIYCNRNFAEVRGGLCWNGKQFKEIFNYASWMAMGNVAFSLADQGFNLLLNLFYGPVVNAARGIAVMIQGIVLSFGDNIQLAVKPQIIKTYAEGESDKMKRLVLSSSKMVFFLIFTLGLPVMLEIDQFLSWWLVEVPKWTSQFTIIVVLITCVVTVRGPLYQAVSATGEMRNFQIANSMIMITFLPITYVTLRFKLFAPTVPFLILLGFNIANFVITSIVALRQVGLSYKQYLKGVILPMFLVGCLAPVMPIFLKQYLAPGIMSFMIVCSVAVVMVLLTAYWVGCTNSERQFISDRIKLYISRRS